MGASIAAANTKQRQGQDVPLALSNVKVYKGAAAAIVLGTGFGLLLVPATVNHVLVGVFNETYDNTAGAAGGYFTTISRTGCFAFAQTGTAITAAHITLPVYFSDDHTVTLTPGTTFAGEIVAVDAAGNVWVDIEPATSAALNNRNWLALAGAADAINPHVNANYIVTTAGVDAMTLAAPTTGIDDGVEIFVSSNTANAHTLTATGLLQTGAAAVNLATFAAQKGAGVRLKAFQAKWNVVHQIGITFS